MDNKFPWPTSGDDFVARAKAAVVGRLGATGAIPVVRVSSAKAPGRAKRFYWGVAKYELRLGKAGRPLVACTAAASSERRSYGLALEDARALGLPVIWETPGYIAWTRAESIIRDYDRSRS